MFLLQLFLGLFAATGLTAMAGSGGDDSEPVTDRTDTASGNLASEEHVLLSQQPAQQQQAAHKPKKPKQEQEEQQQQQQQQQQPPAQQEQEQAQEEQQQQQQPPAQQEQAQAPQQQPPTEQPEMGQDTADQTAPPGPTAPADQTAPPEPAVPGPLTIGGGNIDVMTGRVTSLELPNASDLTSVRILEQPDHGNVTVNPDNSLALVLSGETYTGAMSFRYEATYNDGSTSVQTQNLTAIPGAQDGGWGLGEFYMLETDGNGDLVIEHGDNHREVYVSNSEDALSLKDIADLEGLSKDKITAKWLLEHPDYGGSEDMALKPDAGMELWYASTDANNGPTSNWLLLERGYEYGDIGRLVGKDADGESELHPMVITSWGDGDKPLIEGTMNIYQANSQNVVVTDVAFDAKIQVLNGNNILLDDLVVTGSEINIHDVDGFTLRGSSVVDVVHETSVNDPDIWGPAPNRISGIFVTNSDGVLLEDNLFDHNSWVEDYNYDLSTTEGQPPSFYSHNVYLQYSNEDVTFRDNITMRAASFGAQIRSGGFIEDNIFLDNNGAVAFLGGDYKDRGPIGQYSLVTDNVTTSGAHKTVDKAEGALTKGMIDKSLLASMVDNIVAHLADPNNLDEELAYKETSHEALRVEDYTFYDDTIIYNWKGSQAYENEANGDGIRNPDTNVEGLNTSLLDQTTIQIFAAQVLGTETATIADLADHLRAQAEGALDDTVDADLIVAFFQKGFGITPDLDFSADTLTFVPNDLGEGVRWDNRLNWNEEYLPQDGQNVDLNGNWVNYGGTSRVGDLDFGSGGKLNVGQGYLEVGGALKTGAAGAEVIVDGAGQLWTNGYGDTDALTINVTGGRFANTGEVTGNADLHVSDNGQAILATSGAAYEVGDGNTLGIEGAGTRVGFDGQGGDTAVLTLGDEARLDFAAEDGAFGRIGEFRSGHYDHDEADVLSGVQLGGSTLALDLTGMGTTLSNDILIEADEIIGAFDTLEITGLGGSRDAKVQIDYEKDIVKLLLSAEGDGSGVVNYETIGLQSDTDLQGSEASDLWAALTDGHGTVPDDMPADLPEDAEIYLYN